VTRPSTNDILKRAATERWTELALAATGYVPHVRVGFDPGRIFEVDPDLVENDWDVDDERFIVDHLENRRDDDDEALHVDQVEDELVDDEPVHVEPVFEPADVEPIYVEPVRVERVVNEPIDPELLAACVSLRKLVLSGIYVTDEVAAAIPSLSALYYLDLYDNEIGTEGARAIASLPALSWLDLSSNWIGDEGAHAIASISTLTELILQHSGIGDEGARAIGSLPALTYLHLGGNHIGDEGARLLLGGLAKAPTELRTLMLWHNQIDFLPEEVFKRSDAQHILAAYRRFLATDVKPLNEAKLLVVGREAVGKTSLVRFLTENEARDPDERKTPGIAHQRIETRRWTPDKRDGPQLNVWDFGGQEILHETHKFFLTARSMYLLVLEDRREDDRSVYDWLRTIANRGGESPVIVVINKSDDDQPKLLLDETTLVRDWPSVVACVRTSCNNSDHARRSIERLKSTILATLNQDSRLVHIRDPLPTPWRKVKDSLAELAKPQKVLGQAEFVRLCLELEGGDRISDEHEQRMLLRLLHDLGVIVAYGLGDDAPAVLQNVRLLDPNWLTGAIYKVLTSALVVKQSGEFHREQLAELLDPTDYPPERWEYILSMMQVDGVGLCFRVRGSERETYLVPEALPVNAPVLGLSDDALRFRFDYEFLPRGLIPRFLVEAHPRLTTTRWRMGGVFEAADCKVLVKGDDQRKRIDLWVDGPEQMRRAALHVILEDLERVHQLNPESKPTPKVPLPENPELDVPYQYLRDLERLKGPAHEFMAPGTTRDYVVGHLLDGVGRMQPSERIMRVRTAALAKPANSEHEVTLKQLAVEEGRFKVSAAVVGLYAVIVGAVVALLKFIGVFS
jgi:internalin A